MISDYCLSSNQVGKRRCQQKSSTVSDFNIDISENAVEEHPKAFLLRHSEFVASSNSSSMAPTHSDTHCSERRCKQSAPPKQAGERSVQLSETDDNDVAIIFEGRCSPHNLSLTSWLYCLSYIFSRI